MHGATSVWGVVAKMASPPQNAQKSYESIRFGDEVAPKQYEFIGDDHAQNHVKS